MSFARWTHDWPQFVHRHQKVPLLAQGGAPWRTWLILGNAAKEDAPAQQKCARPRAWRRRRCIALVGETEHEVREVMVEGVSGLLAARPRSGPNGYPRADADGRTARGGRDLFRGRPESCARPHRRGLGTSFRWSNAQPSRSRSCTCCDRLPGINGFAGRCPVTTDPRECDGQPARRAEEPGADIATDRHSRCSASRVASARNSKP